MKCSDNKLYTPIYLRLSESMEWPQDEKAFYVLSRDGLFLCRNTPFFRSCVPVQNFPSELTGQQPFLKLSYPRIPRRLMEQVVGFFDLIGQRYASEAAVLIAWNYLTNAIEIIVPDQVGLVGTGWFGNPYPMELEYKVPTLPSHLVLLGDIHSHVDGPAYASYMDKSDEAHRPGLHLVIGRIRDEPPQFYCEAAADSFRFKVRDLSLILEGYDRRRVDEVPVEWFSKVTVKHWGGKHHYDINNETDSRSGSGTNSCPGRGGYSSLLPARCDDLEATALPAEDKTDCARTSRPATASPPEPLRNGAVGLSAQPPAAGDNITGPESSKPSDISLTP